MKPLQQITAALSQPLAGAIVRALMGYSARTRSELSAELRQPQETIEAALALLVKLDIVQAADDTCSLDTQHHAVIALDVGGTKVLGALMNLQGDELDTFEVRWADFPSSGENDITPLCHMIDRFIAASQGRTLLGMALGLPGITDVDSGIVKWAPGPVWRDLPLRDQLIERYDLPVYLDNDVNLGALGEQRYGAGRHAPNVVCIMVGTGIGGGVVLDGRLYRGANFAAGEVGYMVPSIAHLNNDHVDFGALESEASGTGIADRASRRRGQSTLSAEVFAAAEAGESWALELIAETVGYLAQMVANVTALLDPDCILLGGGVIHSNPNLIDRVRARLSRTLPVTPDLRPSMLGANGALRGGLALVLDSLTSSQDPASTLPT
ncbi:MAG: ROK family transcriptional regulator [Phototrophicaceae bacterium]